MLPFKSGEGHPLPDLSSLSIPHNKSLDAELAFWERLQFEFDMDNGALRTSSKEPSLTHQSRSPPPTLNHQGSNYGTGNYPSLHDATLLAQFAAAMGMPSQGTNAFNTMMSGGNYPFTHNPFNNGPPQGNTQLPSLSALDFSWNNYPPHLRPHNNSGTGPAPSSSGVASASTSNGGTAASSTNTRATRSPSVSATSPVQEQDTQTEAERVVIAEEKRRRNTAASARFRVKKKQRIVNLERTVSDLTGRADDLEKEAADLRRENGWLKEIIMLKGSRLAGVDIANQLAEGNQSSSGSTSRSIGSRAPARKEEVSSSSSEEESEEEPPRSKRKSRSTKK